MVGDNIRVNCLNPGLVLTPDWIKTAKQLTADTGGDWQGYLDGVAREHAPISRFATPEELASFVVFLCSERASYSIGSTYFVEGGMLKGRLTKQDEVEPGELVEGLVGGYTRKPARPVSLPGQDATSGCSHPARRIAPGERCSQAGADRPAGRRVRVTS